MPVANRAPKFGRADAQRPLKPGGKPPKLDPATHSGMRDLCLRLLEQDPKDEKARRDLMDLCGLKPEKGAGDVKRLSHAELDSRILMCLEALEPYGVVQYTMTAEERARAESKRVRP